MSIQKVIEESFEDKGTRESEHSIILEEGNQKSVNSYLIQKIHTLEDRVNNKFDSEKRDIKKIGEEADKNAKQIE